MKKTISVSAPRGDYDNVAETLDRVRASGRYIHGPEERAFCDEFGAYLGTRGSVIGCASGTDALVHALRGLGIGPGDRVATVSHTFHANVQAIYAVGACPVFIDVDDSMNMNPEELEGAHRTFGITAVLAVHLYGRPFSWRIAAFCEVKGIKLIEDCAQAHGALLYSYCGTIGDAAAFSFYPTKNLGALGDGGAVIFKKPIDYVPDHGLDEMQAAVLRVKLGYLNSENAARRRNATRLYIDLQGLPLRVPFLDHPGHVWHQFVVRVPAGAREQFRNFLRGAGIETGVHYPVPAHKFAKGCTYFYNAPLVNTEQLAHEVVSLPVHPYLTTDEVSHVSTTVRNFFR